MKKKLSRATNPAFEGLEMRRLLASAGDPDTSLGGTGWVDAAPTGSNNTIGTSVAVEPTTGDILVAGTDQVTGQLAVARFLHNSASNAAALDPTFADNGILTLTSELGDASAANDILVYNGMIYVCGTYTATGSLDSGIFVMRLTQAGAIDTTFTYDPNYDQFANEMVENSGNLYVAGMDSSSSNVDALVWKIDATTGDGDMSFGTNGVAINGTGGGNTIIQGIAVRSDGKVILGGSDGAAILARVGTDGTLDNDFGFNGIVTPTSDPFASIDQLTIDGLDNVYTVGTSTVNFVETVAAVMKFDADGVEDPAFDGDGVAVVDLQTAGTNVFGAGITLDGSGRVVVAGIIQDSVPTISAFASRFNQATGALDNAFGTSGIASTLADGQAGAADATIDGDGNVVIGGGSSDALLAARFFGATSVGNVDPVLDTVLISSPINENGSATLSGTYHDDDLGDTHTLDIDWNGDGTYDVLAAPVSGGVFSFMNQYLDDNPTATISDTFNVGVRLNDSATGSDTGSASLTVNNVAPTVDPIGGPASPVVRQQSVSFTGSFSDPGTLDTFEVSWDFGDGNVIAYHPSTDSGALTPSHTYTTAGNFTVTLNVKDDDGGIGTQTLGVTVAAAAISGGNLVVGGTDGADVITVNTTSAGQWRVLFSGVEVGRFTPTGHVIVNAADGADLVTIANGVGATEVYGGAGNDTLRGGNGSDTLDGGADNDSLDGNAGNDSLLGGEGDDTITGGADNDTSIGGNGNDSISNNGGDDRLEGGAGNDTLIAGGGADVAYGGADNDSIVGGSGDDSLFGEAGNDTINGGGGSDFIDGGSGNDDLNGGGGTDIVLGGLDNDLVQGGSERDVLIGGDGADSIIGNADEDLLIAGTTSNDGNEANLKSILAIWDDGGLTYAQRRDALLAGLLQTSNLFDDLDVDTLTGGAGTDWFILDTGQDINDNKAGETETGV